NSDSIRRRPLTLRSLALGVLGSAGLKRRDDQRNQCDPNIRRACSNRRTLLEKTKQQRKFAPLPMPDFRLLAFSSVPALHSLSRARSRERDKGEGSEVEEWHVARQLPGLDARYGCGRIRWPPLPAFPSAQS